MEEGLNSACVSKLAIIKTSPNKMSQYQGKGSTMSLGVVVVAHSVAAGFKIQNWEELMTHDAPLQTLSSTSDGCAQANLCQPPNKMNSFVRNQRTSSRNKDSRRVPPWTFAKPKAAQSKSNLSFVAEHTHSLSLLFFFLSTLFCFFSLVSFLSSSDLRSKGIEEARVRTNISIDDLLFPIHI